MDTLHIPSSIWIPAAAHRLHMRWPTVDPLTLESAAEALWRDERLRQMEPRAAAEEWLRPVVLPQR